ncbi:AraC family transcriptional regulator [Vibrio renipiscarius]|uniref:AraC family transcriptional regulator n=1 Tax=Vibrio renipiscarius TaxID=1461322 RepID=UPI00354EA71B
MHYSISHQTTNIEFLSITPRKKLLKHTLLTVECGLVLVRLGKHEYAVKEGQAIWLPFDCLASVCCLPQTRVQHTEVSCRVAQPLPKQAGYIELNELSQAIINRLAQMPDERLAKVELLNLLLKELTDCSPTLTLDSFSQQVSQWHPDQACDLPQDVQVTLRVREARKRLLSGQAQVKVINDLFSGNVDAFRALYHTIAGE